MKIDYPEIDWADVREGDVVLRALAIGDGTTYYEFTVNENALKAGRQDHWTHYLIERPKPEFPTEPGAVIIAKKLGGQAYPEGVILYRHRGTNSYARPNNVRWKSPALKVGYQDIWGEKEIEDWVLAKVVPA